MSLIVWQETLENKILNGENMKAEKKMTLMYLGNCEEIDCEYFQWCGDSYWDRNTECYCLLNGAAVYRYNVENEHIECPMEKTWDEDNI